MTFLNNILLWTGLAAAGVLVPIIIHLLNRYRHRQVDWAAMELLRKALTIRSRQIRLEDVIMLILRCVAILLIAFALARPTIMGSAGDWLGGRQQVGVVVAVDASYSMGWKQVTSRFDRAKQQAAAIFKTVRPGDPATLVLLGESPRVLLRNVGYDPDVFTRVLNDASLKAERLNVGECADELKLLVTEMKSPVKECYIITDSQATTWNNLPEKAHSALSNLGKAARVSLLSVSDGGTENVGIVRFELAGGGLYKGAAARYVAEVKNFGRQPVNSINVRLSAEHKQVDLKTIGHLEPGESQPVPLYYRCDEGGHYRLAAELARDPVQIDNEAFAVAHVRDQVRVMCVDGEPSQRPWQSETDYLVKSLQPKEGGAIQAERVLPAELPLRKLAEFQIIMLANVGELPPEQVKALRDFVAGGGGLVIFLGGRIDPVAYNRKMVADGVSLLTGELGEVIKAPKERPLGFEMEPAGSGHPLARVIASLPPELVSERHVTSFISVKLAPARSRS